MRVGHVIRAAIPNATDALCEHILWGRTPFPCGKVTAKSIYKAANRFRRVEASGRRLCDLCDNLVETHKWTCETCETALERARYYNRNREAG